MPWKKDDYYAFFLLIILMIAGAILTYITWEQSTYGQATWKFKQIFIPLLKS